MLAGEARVPTAGEGGRKQVGGSRHLVSHEIASGAQVMAAAPRSNLSASGVMMPLSMADPAWGNAIKHFVNTTGYCR